MDYNIKKLMDDSKIKFYFSLIFTSIHDYECLVNVHGDYVNIPNYETKLNEDIVNNVIWNNKRINLSDKTILRLFDKEEVKNYYDTYSSLNVNFNTHDPEDLENFYIYMLLEKVKEKKEIEYGTIYDLFDTFLDEEVINAVANLDLEDKKTFINLFGIKGDLPFEINSNDHVKNDILIKLYSYMLLKREDADIPSIIRNIMDKDAREYNFYDYIRSLCGDKNLTNEFIFEMFKKMDYNSMKYIKDVFGENLDKKKKPSREKEFKRAINNLVVIVKINKEYRKRRETEFNHSNKKKAGFGHPKKENKQNGETKKEDKKNINEDEVLKEDKKQKDDTFKKENKKNQEKVKEKKEDKKLRLSKFLLENGISKEDFLKAVTLLDIMQREIIELYYGLKKKPLDLSDIAQKLSKPPEEIVDLLEKAEKKIVDLIKSGEIEKINKKEKEDKKKKTEKIKKVSGSNKLKGLISSGKVTLATVIMVLETLKPIEKTVVNKVLESDETSYEEIAKDLNMNKEEVINVYETASDKIISSLEIKNVTVEVKEEDDKKAKDLKKENKNFIKDEGGYPLANFLMDNNLTKKKFFEGFYKLDSFSKKVMSLYLGLYSNSFSISFIAKMYNTSPEEIKKVISNAKNKIINNSLRLERINLNLFLKENKITMDEYEKIVEGISPFNRKLLNDYFKNVDLSALAKRYNTNEAGLNKMVKNALEEVLINAKENKKEPKEKAGLNKLDKYLIKNNIDKDNFFKALNLLSFEEKMLISMYFGLKGREMNEVEMALSLKLNPIMVKSNLASALSNINYLSKLKDLNKIIMNQNYQNIKNKINKMYSVLISDTNFVSLISSNPDILNMLSVVNGMNYDLETTSKILGISSDKLMNNLSGISNLCDEYFNNMNKGVKTSFKDEEKENHKKR